MFVRFVQTLKFGVEGLSSAWGVSLQMALTGGFNKVSTEHMCISRPEYQAVLLLTHGGHIVKLPAQVIPSSIPILIRKP